MSNSETAPYAPVHNVLTVIRRRRDKGLPDPLNLKELTRLGVPEGNAPRTLAALRFLGLVNEEGYLTPAFEQLGKASTAEYPEVLAEVLRAAYSGVFTIVDPREDSEVSIHDAFRHYKPPAQRNRMVTLFLGLCREAAIVPGGPPVRKAKVRRGEGRSPAKTAESPPTDGTLTQPKPAVAGHIVFGEPETDYRLVSTLLQRLPRSGKWSMTQRNRWLQALTANIDLMIEIVEEDTPG